MGFSTNAKANEPKTTLVLSIPTREVRQLKLMLELMVSDELYPEVFRNFIHRTLAQLPNE